MIKLFLYEYMCSRLLHHGPNIAKCSQKMWGPLLGIKIEKKAVFFFVCLFKSKTSILYKKKGKIYQGDKGYLQKENVYS